MENRFDEDRCAMVDHNRLDKELGAAELFVRRVNNKLDVINKENRELSPNCSLWEYISPDIENDTHFVEYFPIYGGSQRDDAEYNGDYSHILDRLVEGFIKSFMDDVQAYVEPEEKEEIYEYVGVASLIEGFEHCKRAAASIAECWW